MLDLIKKCENCELCKNQKPLLDSCKECKIIWVGLSAKKVDDVEKEIPLSPETNSGALISTIESNYENISTYKTNIVKCLPLDEKGKLRYPNSKEMNICFKNFIGEIEQIKPKLVFLLGEKVTKAVERNFKIQFEKRSEYEYLWKKHENIYYIPIHHPSYICVYKRKYIELYIDGIKKVIHDLLRL